MKFITCTASVLLAWMSTECFAVENINVSREKITFLQQVDPATQQNLKDAGMENRSLVFYRHVSGAELNTGVDMMVDADGAVIQLSPLDQVKDGKRIQKTRVPVEMTLSNEKSTRRVNDESIALHHKTEGLRENFPELYGRAHVMKIPKDMGRGKFRLQADGNANKGDAYVLYVLDKGSDISLNVKTSRSRFTNKGRLNFEAFVESHQSTEVDSITSTLIAPEGTRFDIKGKLVKGRFKADWPINVDVPRSPGELWQLEVRSRIRNSKGEVFERVAVVATDIYEQTAEITAVGDNTENLHLTLNVQVPGRYEVRALVYGTDSSGDAKPIFLNYQAEWLEPGQRNMILTIDQNQLRNERFNAPYTVRDIQLLDQGRMAVLQSKVGQWQLP